MSRTALLPALALLVTATTEPQPPAQQSLEQETEHVVQPGETLTGIANRVKVPRVLIAEANGLTAPYALRTGQKLTLPRTSRRTVKRGDTAFSIAYETGVPWHDIAVANGIDSGRPLHPGQVLLIPTLVTASGAASAATAASAPAKSVVPASRFAWPLAGPVRRGFTARAASADYHDGLDITASEGTAVRAAAPGKVLFADTEPKQYGNLVVVDHGYGWVSAYAFLSRVTVAKGEEVRAGERIGLVGHTGLAKGSELHFEIRRGDDPVDPTGELPERK
jgi:murein DD-endopeptidase MepM/ murein hydrolase activator NlpD